MRNDLFNDERFDRHFTNVEKTIKRTWTVMLVVWAISAIVTLATLGGLAYVAWHFISKVW